MKEVSIEELKERQSRNEDIHLLDVREDDERAAFNIGGRHLPLGKVQRMETESIDDWKDEEIIVYCKSGKRSAMACLFLEQNGFSNVANLVGGAEAWKNAH